MKITPFTFESLSGDEPTPKAVLAGGLDSAADDTVEEEEVITFSEEELEAAKKQAYDEGFVAGKKEGLREVEKEAQARQIQVKEIVTSFDGKLQSMQQDYQSVLQQRQTELGQLVLACADKLAGEALRKHPAGEISEMIESCLAGLFDAPQVIAKLHPDVAPLLQETLPASVTIQADASLQPGDCMLSWQHGQAMRDSALLWDELQQIVNRHFALSAAEQQASPAAEAPAATAETAAEPAETQAPAVEAAENTLTGSAEEELSAQQIDALVEPAAEPDTTEEILTTIIDNEGEDHE